MLPGRHDRRKRNEKTWLYGSGWLLHGAGRQCARRLRRDDCLPDGVLRCICRLARCPRARNKAGAAVRPALSAEAGGGLGRRHGAGRYGAGRRVYGRRLSAHLAVSRLCARFRSAGHARAARRARRVSGKLAAVSGRPCAGRRALGAAFVRAGQRHRLRHRHGAVCVCGRGAGDLGDGAAGHLRFVPC